MSAKERGAAIVRPALGKKAFFERARLLIQSPEIDVIIKNKEEILQYLRTLKLDERRSQLLELCIRFPQFADQIEPGLLLAAITSSGADVELNQDLIKILLKPENIEQLRQVGDVVLLDDLCIRSAQFCENFFEDIQKTLRNKDLINILFFILRRAKTEESQACVTAIFIKALKTDPHALFEGESSTTLSQFKLGMLKTILSEPDQTAIFEATKATLLFKSNDFFDRLCRATISQNLEVSELATMILEKVCASFTQDDIKTLWTKIFLDISAQHLCKTSAGISILAGLMRKNPEYVKRSPLSDAACLAVLPCLTAEQIKECVAPQRYHRLFAQVSAKRLPSMLSQAVNAYSFNPEKDCVVKKHIAQLRREDFLEFYRGVTRSEDKQEVLACRKTSVKEHCLELAARIKITQSKIFGFLRTLFDRVQQKALSIELNVLAREQAQQEKKPPSVADKLFGTATILQGSDVPLAEKNLQHKGMFSKNPNNGFC